MHPSQARFPWPYLVSSRQSLEKKELLLKDVLARNAAVIQKREGVSPDASLSIALWQYFATFKLVADIRGGPHARADFDALYNAHLSSDTSKYLDKVGECVNDIGEKWLYYNGVLK